uniref:Phytoene synthase n=1 Tax=Globisporangium ultimum (strain ATCC 200006 / CBS 805.95 / DAOM BR144) TaxID=431595 RepID=K3X1A1_GLOUD
MSTTCRAVNSEIATIKDTIRNNQATGKIRMQWWREKIYNLYTSPSSSGNPPQETFLLRGLEKAIHDHDLTRRWFERLLDARDDDLDTDQPLDLSDIEVYADKTAASLLYLTLECLGIRDDTADRVASHAGAAIGLATLLRGTPHHSVFQQIYLPENLMLKHNLTVDDHFEASEDPAKGAKLAPVVFEVACCAMEHLHEARALQKELPRAARAAFLPVVSTSMYLAELEKANFNAYDPTLFQRNALSLHYEILKHYFLRKY